MLYQLSYELQVQPSYGRPCGGSTARYNRPMAIAHDRCICVGKAEYSETSQILSLLGRAHGLVRVIAKGAHRRSKAGSSKFDGGIDLLDVGDAVGLFDPGRDLGTLTEWGLRQGHLKLRGNLRGIYLGQYAAELICTFLEEHDPHADLFDRFEDVLNELAGAGGGIVPVFSDATASAIGPWAAIVQLLAVRGGVCRPGGGLFFAEPRRRGLSELRRGNAGSHFDRSAAAAPGGATRSR